MAAQRSKKGSEKVLGRGSGEGFSEKGACSAVGFTWAGSSDIFYFSPFSKGGGWGSEERGNFSEMRGKRGGKRVGGEEG